MTTTRRRNVRKHDAAFRSANAIRAAVVQRPLTVTSTNAEWADYYRDLAAASTTLADLADAAMDEVDHTGIVWSALFDARDAYKNEARESRQLMDSRLVAHEETVRRIAARRVVLQPAELENRILPYPYFIGVDGMVGRQDKWKGAPSQLIGFQSAQLGATVDLDFAAFWADPQAAIDMYPVFAHADGSFNTYAHQQIASVQDGAE